MPRPNKFQSKYSYEKTGLDDLLGHYINLHQSGIPLTKEAKDTLIRYGYIKQTDYSNELADNPAPEKIIVNDNLEAKYKDIQIKKEDWLAHDGNPLLPNKQFIEWVDSQLSGVSHAIYNEQYEIYKLQAKRWMQDTRRYSDCNTPDERKKFFARERNRCIMNSLYGLNRYLWMKEGEVDSGKLKFEAWENQAVVLWVLDCGFSSIIGKLRQTGFTTFILGRAEMRARLKRNYFIKFITENVKKAEEIFESKLKFAYSEQPEYMKVTVHNDTGQKFSYMFKDGKGVIKGSNSSVVVEAPYKTAINGGQPNEVLVDECGNISILTPMINEGRPALFWLNPKTGEWEMKRQLVAFGTAGDMDKGKGQFESEYMAAVNAWRERDFQHGLVPIFIDAFSKPGITREKYETEKRSYYRKANGVQGSEKFKIQFHQHYPVSIEDMFLRSSETLIPIGEIVEQINNIYALPEQPQYGYMVPIYDQSQPTPDLYFPFRVVGAAFKPTRIEDDQATVIVVRPPQDGWKNRYYQGTDPISSVTGNSDMASSIQDVLLNEVSAIMKFRSRDHNYCFAQASLLGIWYNTRMPELIESNIGQTYIDFKKIHRLGRIVRNDQLPIVFRTSTGGEGISKKSHNAPYILNETREIVEHYAEGIKIIPFWLQLKTYVKKDGVNGYVSYSTEDAKLYRDDVIDAVTYGKINAKAHSRLNPENAAEEAKRTEKKKKLRYRYDENFNLKLDMGERSF